MSQWYGLQVQPLRISAGFQYNNMVRIETYADGSCLFHALALAYYMPYRTGRLGGRVVDRFDIVREIRAGLARKLGEPINALNPTGPRYYDVINRGALASLSETDPSFTLEQMQHRLDSKSDISHPYFEYISLVMNKDIYIIDATSQDVYITGDEDRLYKGRPSVVLFFVAEHFELIGLVEHQDTGQSITTYFDPKHPFIVSIQSRITARVRI